MKKLRLTLQGLGSYDSSQIGKPTLPGRDAIFFNSATKRAAHERTDPLPLLRNQRR